MRRTWYEQRQHRSHISASRYQRRARELKDAHFDAMCKRLGFGGRRVEAEGTAA